jgi:acetylornithine deacetylase
MNLFQLTRQLIDIPSLTGDEGAIGEYLKDYLLELGYEAELQELSAKRANVIARTASRPRLFFSTHMDTVPPFCKSAEDEGYIHGRGACDAKGIIASQIFAAQKLRAEGLTEIGLLFTVDEEAGSGGANLANQHPLGNSCEFLVNGEPTDNKLAIGSKGSLRLRLKTHGRTAHSAYPENGDSAIERLLDVLEDIRRHSWPTDEVFGETTCNIGIINGGIRANVIPDKAEAELQIRLVSSAESVKVILAEVVGERADIEYLSANDPMKFHVLDGFQHCVVRFTTDIPYLSNWGTPLLLGPGSIFEAHTSHERVPKQELSAAVDMYARLARTLLGTQPKRAGGNAG